MSKKTQEKNKEITTEAATAILIQERQARVIAVEDGIQKLLKEHNCDLDLQMTLSTNQKVPKGRLVVIPLADQPSE